ncbi:PIN domain-containing protein [Natronomonas sp. EA1]|uniref:PIN domain-containing protein n=1 Tax=Natronomonas sp. EA1 TaxID=3421655 RepID=UPI003EC14A75
MYESDSMIADTDFLIALSGRDADAHAKLAALEEEGVPIKIPAMAMLEFYIGVGAVATPDQEKDARRVLSQHPFVPMDAEIAMRAGRRIRELDAKQFKKGEAAIGATAEVEGEKVLTRNVEDFEKMGFEVESW